MVLDEAEVRQIKESPDWSSRGFKGRIRIETMMLFDWTNAAPPVAAVDADEGESKELAFDGEGARLRGLRNSSISLSPLAWFSLHFGLASGLIDGSTLRLSSRVSDEKGG